MESEKVTIEYGTEDLKQILGNYIKEKFVQILKKEEN